MAERLTVSIEANIVLTCRDLTFQSQFLGVPLALYT